MDVEGVVSRKSDVARPRPIHWTVHDLGRTEEKETGKDSPYLLTSERTWGFCRATVCAAVGRAVSGRRMRRPPAGQPSALCPSNPNNQVKGSSDYLPIDVYQTTASGPMTMVCLRCVEVGPL